VGSTRGQPPVVAGQSPVHRDQPAAKCGQPTVESG